VPTELESPDIMVTESVLNETPSKENVSSEPTSSLVPSKSPSTVPSSSKEPVLSSTPLETPLSETPANEIRNNKLLEKYGLEIGVYAWIDSMPISVDEGETSPLTSRPHFSVRFMAIENGDIPKDIRVSAKIISKKATTEVVLNGGPQYAFGTFRVENPQLLQMEVREKLTVVVTFVIGGEEQTLSFNPIVADVW